MSDSHGSRRREGCILFRDTSGASAASIRMLLRREKRRMRGNSKTGLKIEPSRRLARPSHQHQGDAARNGGRRPRCSESVTSSRMESDATQPL